MNSKIVIIFCLFFAVLFIACNNTIEKQRSELININTGSNFQKSENLTEKIAPKNINDNVRRIDFQNFTHPYIPTKYKEYFGNRKNLVVKNNQISSNSNDEADQFDLAVDVNSYIDLTGDNIEEAVLVLSILLPNRAMPSCLFVYTIDNSKPKLLWSYESGKWDVKGFKDVYIDNNNLVIEEFNGEDSPICCPKSFYKTAFKWDGNSFQVMTNELHSYDKENRLP